MAQWVESIVQARYLVASLGESAAPPWWRTEALSQTGQRFLVRLFPRTALSAGLHTAGRAAASAHDSHIGRGGAYHLFRLPVAQEMAVHDLLRSPHADALLQELAALPTRDERLDLLETLAGGESVAAAHGPLHCGTTLGLRRGKTLQRLCAAYASAFRHGAVVYPFLLEQESL